jgi:hypothetical protein
MISADNFHFDLTGVPLLDALNIAFAGGTTAKGWAEIDTDPSSRGAWAPWSAMETAKRLVLFWTADHAMTPLPAPMGPADVEPFVRTWLQAAEYGPEPDHDGDNSMGWRVYNEAWGHVGPYRTAICAIEPVWLMHGK